MRQPIGPFALFLILSGVCIPLSAVVVDGIMIIINPFIALVDTIPTGFATGVVDVCNLVFHRQTSF